jgi:hypothetical protein
MGQLVERCRPAPDGGADHYSRRHSDADRHRDADGDSDGDGDGDGHRDADRRSDRNPERHPGSVGFLAHTEPGADLGLGKRSGRTSTTQLLIAFVQR